MPAPPSVCPVCGGDVPAGTRACPHCGADDRTGWSDDACLQNLGVYTEEDYQNTIEEEFGSSRKKPKAKQLVTWIAAVIMLLLFLKVFVLRC